MQRFHQLDFFRGLLLVLITVDHFFTHDNIIVKFTYEFIGWVSGAEGFVFLSGLTAGLIYTYKFQTKGEKYVQAASVKRSWTIYKYHAFLFIILMILISPQSYLNQYWLDTYETFVQAPAFAVFMGAWFLYQPPFLDILPMYAIFMLAIPFSVQCFHKGLHVPVLLSSFFLYLTGTLNSLTPLSSMLVLWENVETGAFSFLCWQFLFIAGLFMGFLLYQKKLEKLSGNKVLFPVAALFSIVMFLINFFYISVEGFDLLFWTEKEHLRPLRVLNFASVFIVTACLVNKNKDWFKFRPLCYLGRHSLEVFSFHIILVIVLKPFNDPLNSIAAYKITENYFIYPFESLIVLLVLIPALFLAPKLFKINKYPFSELPKYGSLKRK